MKPAINQIKIAIIEDDVILREELSQFLQSHHFIVHEVNNGLSLGDLLLNKSIDVIILDLNLPGQSGFEIAKSVRATYPQIGIAMLTARTALVDRIKSYEYGADIYLPKPTPPQELLAAINSLARRIGDTKPDGWVLHAQSGQLISPNDENTIQLIAVEMLLLKALAQAPNHSLESESICEILSEQLAMETMTKRSLENIISRLRKKIQPALDGSERRIIHSVWGTGYQLYLPISITNS
ncbi:response regulator transcription factor [Polynucleobacter sp. 31A-FELB]|uniref:response regulator transcription factor n=1 Tax=Polynucleobacter sp. 31A-FELB TaxID=2689096 RepID=UPI001C0DA833|nr:response regulator transcription factor [Polynucleobacter sp. 31A-FELB]MBU3588273.1 response regulator transcription factor [Polynucleobacter sp. 31A-FELB]